MNGRARRTQRINDRIKETALQLFTTYGIDRVSMDEIAAAAKVSKVTIYKYFHSKEELHAAAVDLYGDRVVAATEQILNQDQDFLEKLKRILMAPVHKSNIVSSQHLFDLLRHDIRAEGRLNQRIKHIIFRFFEEGKRQGYLDPDLPFELLYLHARVYQAGFEANLEEAEAMLADPEMQEKMFNLFFLGIVKSK